MDMIHEAGWPIFPILAVGLAAVVAAIRYALSPDATTRTPVWALSLATLVLGLMGTGLGLQASFSHIREVAPDMRWIAMVGAYESLHNLSAACAAATLALIVVAAGSLRADRHTA